MSFLDQRDLSGEGVCRRLVALPECDDAAVGLVAVREASGSLSRLENGDGALAWVEQVARIRDQAVAVVAIDVGALARARSRAGAEGDVEISVTPRNGRGSACRNAGPFTRVLESSVLNYVVPTEEEPRWLPPSDDRGRTGGAVTYCNTLEDCVQAGTDVLFVVADQLHSSPIIQVYAAHEASYLGLNVSVVGTSTLESLSSLALHDFIRDVYESRSASHFGDGHLGFVVLIGDAYADDNVTVMIPEYDGYGGTEQASDHYYACVSGEDEFEDVMIGRLSVGNIDELAAVVNKTANYTPLPAGEVWTKSILLVAGMFYTTKDEYVALFNEYEELIPDEYAVDRIYRHDFANDHLCSIAVVNGFNDGHLFVNFAGDGWIATWYRTMDTTDIPLMQNDGRFPIVLSMACMTGWFDNVSEIGPDGSYDCLAEQFVSADDRGAVACLAASRNSDGGIFRTFTKEIYRAAFEENCVFLGETFAVAKLMHLQNGGNLNYARHFNLFGDPALLYKWYETPGSRPELLVRPYETTISPELPAIGDDLTLDLSVHNYSAIPVSDVPVRIVDESDDGALTIDLMIPELDDWSETTVSAVIPQAGLGWHSITARVDPDEEIEEIDEGNNTFHTDVYVYPHAPGFPAYSGIEPYGPCVGVLDDELAHVVVMESDARVRAIDQDGQTCWLSDPASDPVDYGPEIAPAIGDLNGDGENEIVAVRRMGLAAFSASGSPLWQILTDDPIGAPVLADADADGDLDVILATKMFFGGNSHILAIDEDGTQIWSFATPTGDPLSATPAVGDLDQDGVADFCYGTQSGKVGAASCAQNPPVALWGPSQLGTEPIRMLGLADLDADGSLELAVGGDQAFCLNAEDGSQAWAVPLESDAVALSLGDVDADGIPDVIVGTADGSLTDIEQGVSLWTTQLPGVSYWSPAIADVMGDAAQEICVATDDGSLCMLSPEGSLAMAPIPVPGAFGSPFAADLSGDKGLEICVASSDGRLFAFALDDDSSDPVVEWRGSGGDAAHAGLLCQPFAGSFSHDVVLRGRYIMTGDVVVESGVTLSVQAGAVIEFDSSASPVLDVWGTLQAHGGASAPIRMLPSDAGGRSPSWDGIRLRPGSAASLAACLISGAEMGVCGSNASLDAMDCSFTDNTYGAYLSQCSLTASSSVFSHSDSTGMYLSGGAGTIEDCVFDENVVSGLWCHASGSYSVARSTLSGTTSGSGLVCYRFSNVQVDSCTLTGNAEHGALVHNASADLNGCTITGNGKDGILARKLAEPIVRWCTITSNRIGVAAETGAMPNLGLGDGLQPEAGFNSIYGNQMAAVANFNADAALPLSARENWWGVFPPNGRIFIGYVRYAPCLEAPPETGPPIPTTVDAAESEPLAFRLGHCSPNPFSTSTTVRYDVPAGLAALEVSVFDVAGRLVTTLYSGQQEPGTYRVTWDGRDRLGSNVAAGIYFVRLETSDFRATAKMALLK